MIGCPALGAPLARLETRIGVEHLLSTYPGLRLAEPGTPAERRPHLILRNLKRLAVTR